MGNEAEKPQHDLPAAQRGDADTIPPRSQSEADNGAPLTGAARCPVCFSMMYGLHCKLICPNCGYREDCSDLFPPVA